MPQVLERGNIYFVYRPRVEETSVSGLEDIQRFFMILSPHNNQLHRLIVIGRKKLPEIEDRHERNWGFVQKVAHDAHDVEAELSRITYATKTRANGIWLRLGRPVKASTRSFATRTIPISRSRWSCRPGPVKCRTN